MRRGDGGQGGHPVGVSAGQPPGHHAAPVVADQVDAGGAEPEVAEPMEQHDQLTGWRASSERVEDQPTGMDLERLDHVAWVAAAVGQLPVNLDLTAETRPERKTGSPHANVDDRR